MAIATRCITLGNGDTFLATGLVEHRLADEIEHLRKQLAALQDDASKTSADAILNNLKPLLKSFGLDATTVGCPADDCPCCDPEDEDDIPEITPEMVADAMEIRGACHQVTLLDVCNALPPGYAFTIEAPCEEDD